MADMPERRRQKPALLPVPAADARYSVEACAKDWWVVCYGEDPQPDVDGDWRALLGAFHLAIAEDRARRQKPEPEDDLDACVRMIDDVCKWFAKNGMIGAADALHSERDRFLLPLARACDDEQRCAEPPHPTIQSGTREALAAARAFFAAHDGHFHDTSTTVALAALLLDWREGA